MLEPSLPEGYRLVTLVQSDPPGEVLRHAEMMPGGTGRYGKVVRFRHDRGKTVYEVLHFKAGRPPTREEVLGDLRDDLARLDAQIERQKKCKGLRGWIDRVVFSEASAAELERKRRDILETAAAVEEDYRPGEAVPIL